MIGHGNEQLKDFSLSAQSGEMLHLHERRQL